MHIIREKQTLNIIKDKQTLLKQGLSLIDFIVKNIYVGKRKIWNDICKQYLQTIFANNICKQCLQK